MDSYVKSVILTLILAVCAYEIMCTTQKGASSASFIQQETNQQPLQPGVKTAPGPTQGNPTQSEPVPPQNPSQSIPVNPQLSNRGGSRDYVNPNRPQQSQTIPNPSGTTPQNVPPQPTSIQSGSNRGAVRDYVNPSIGQGGGGVNQGSSRPGNPSGQQFRPSPRSSNIGSRDYVNPNFNTNQGASGGISYANIAGRNSNSPSTSNPPNINNFPALPNRNYQPIPQNVQSTTPLSYASRVSGGITTKSPIGQQRPAVLGPTSSTTQKPDEGPTDLELRDFSEALLRRDVNNAAKFLTVNVQGKTTSQSKADQAPDRLLSIQQDAYKISTISKLKLLHNNYILDITENEHVTPQEKQEENELLDEMLTTPIMQYTRNFLVSKGKLSRDPKDFKDLLKVLWFNMYSRGSGRIGSSGFEHIFLAELKNNEVSGLHNWVYFDQAEMSKIVDYLGYMKKIDLGEKGAILKFHFNLKGVDKPVGSMFIGTSPELEMALYTTCYMFRANRVCPLRLNGNNFVVRTYNYRYRGKNMIGSAFPEI